MRVIEPGHLYALESMEGTNPQKIQFIEKVPYQEGKTFITKHDGTTNEEVLRVLIDRLIELDKKLPSDENKEAQYHLLKALDWLERRTQDRLNRGVENTPKP